MLDPGEFYKFLNSIGVNFFTGVPDSLLKSFCGYVADHSPANSHIISSNEGAAVGIGIGYHLATGNIPMVYMQNSGLGNAINPLISLADQEVYSIPMIILIGWRGEPETKDEPQHIKQGKVMLPMIKSMKMPYETLIGDFKKDKKIVKSLLKKAKETQGPVFLVAKKNIFKKYQYTQLEHKVIRNIQRTREDVIREIIPCFPKNTLIVATTGMASREIFEYRESLDSNHGLDFLTVGGMGHASQIALGIAMKSNNKNIVCIDGDGAAIMHLGSMAIIGQFAPKNFKHILLNNGAHDSVGGQPTVGFELDFTKLAKSFGYKIVSTKNNQPISESVQELFSSNGPSFLEIKIRCGSRPDLGRPTKSPKDNKNSFMQNFQKD
tara:strand:- start:12407 stop:13543 length:1137 start_codon:yes stop_codon:yes gene_type:complete